MLKKNDQITDISAEIDSLYGADWTQQRKEFNEAAWQFYLDETKKIVNEKAKSKKNEENDIAES